jgi:hypothetical protein
VNEIPPPPDIEKGPSFIKKEEKNSTTYLRIPSKSYKLRTVRSKSNPPCITAQKNE